jgi:hypothetical protein
MIASPRNDAASPASARNVNFDENAHIRSAPRLNDTKKVFQA